jgi:hypothetical protein
MLGSLECQAKAMPIFMLVSAMAAPSGVVYLGGGVVAVLSSHLLRSSG